MSEAAGQTTPLDRPDQSAGSLQPRLFAAIVAIVVLAGALRLIGLDAVPPGINQDEADRAYEAYCLRHTGRDHLGASWPIFFRAFGKADYPPGPYIYLLIPFQAVLGMSVWSTRLPAALLGTLNVWWLYLLVKRIYGDRAGLLAALLLAISPWHIHLSRMAFEVSLCPPMVTLGLLLSMTRNKRPRTLVRLLVSGIVFGLALWTYNAFRVVVPLLLLGAVAIYAKPLWAFIAEPRGKRLATAFLVGFMISMGPFLWATIKTPNQAWGRAAAISILSVDMSMGAKVQQVCGTYWMHLSPGYLFFSGDPRLPFGLAGYGKLHYFCVLLLPLGLFRAIRRWWSERFGWLLLWWILIAPLPAAATDLEFAHTLRSAGVLPAYEILSAIGLDLILVAALRRARWVHTAAVAVSAAVVTLHAGYFVHLYQTRYPLQAEPIFGAEWQAAFADIRGREADYDAVVLTSINTNQLGMLYLFYNQVDPRQYFAEPRQIQESEYWDHIVRVGKYFFVPTQYLEDVAQLYPPGSRFLIAARPNEAVLGVPLAQFHYPSQPNAAPVLILYEVRSRAVNPGS